jgi:hypothetical protein
MQKFNKQDQFCHSNQQTNASTAKSTETHHRGLGQLILGKTDHTWPATQQGLASSRKQPWKWSHALKACRLDMASSQPVSECCKNYHTHETSHLLPGTETKTNLKGLPLFFWYQILLREDWTSKIKDIHTDSVAYKKCLISGHKLCVRDLHVPVETNWLHIVLKLVVHNIPDQPCPHSNVKKSKKETSATNAPIV